MNLALLCGGGLANWLDRLLNGGAVTDFVSFGVGWLRTGIFNVADVAIMAGAALLLLPIAREEASRES
jgi:signal peptidase II